MTQIHSINPVTNEKIKSYSQLTNARVTELIDNAKNSYQSWSGTSFSERSELMLKAANILESNAGVLARTITDEMGKTIESAKAEIEKCAWVCRYYAENAPTFLEDSAISTDAGKSFVTYNPLGTILAVMPWNYPFWQVFRFAAPALMAGNVALLKHASNVPGCSLLIQKVFEKAGFPEHTFTSLIISSHQVEKIIENPSVKAVTLTGSGPAGSAVAATAARNIKKSVLELGGNDPYLVLKDADIELAAEQCTQSRLLNAGQSCIGAKRFIVVESIYDEFLNLFIEKMNGATFGNPHENVTMGPLARKELRDEVHEQVEKSVDAGAKLILGGKIPDMPGAFYPPTILTEVKPGMPAYSEEIFGPVAAVIRVEDEAEAIRIANDTIYGLGACVFTRDAERGEHIAKHKLNAGCCFVNQFVKSDPRLPFGGINQSGFGRELSDHGIREFVNIKTVYVA